MENISFVKTPEEISYMCDGEHPIWMNNCEGFFAAWATDPEAIQRILPKPLEMMAPIVIVYVINAYEPTFSHAYKEAAIMVPVLYGDKAGSYPLSMLLQGSDNAVTLGREELGIPKKNADDITLSRVGDKAYASITRLGVTIFEAELSLGAYNDASTAGIFGDRVPGNVTDGILFFHKFGLDQDAQGKLDIADVRMLQVLNQTKTYRWEEASLQVQMTPSACDPWSELPIVAPLGAGWTKMDTGLLGTLEVTPLTDQDEVAPKLLAGRYDTPIFGRPTFRI